MKNLQLYALLMLLSTGYIANARQESNMRNEESWSVRHNIRSIENHIDLNMNSHFEVRHFINRVESYIRALQDDSATPTKRELAILEKACMKAEREAARFNDRSMNDAIAQLREKAGALSINCKRSREAVMDVVEIQSKKSVQQGQTTPGYKGKSKKAKQQN